MAAKSMAAAGCNNNIREETAAGNRGSEDIDATDAN